MKTAQKNQNGFTLIELMIVIAIIGILAAVALPQYNTYIKQSRFSEVVMAASALKSPAEIAVQSGKVTANTGLNHNANGIPSQATSHVGNYVSSVTITNGVIVATGTGDVDNGTFTIEASIINSGIRWIVDSSAATDCTKLGLC